MSIERKQVSEKFKKVQDRIKTLNNKKAHVYETKEKFIPSVGYIHEIETRADLAKALTEVNGKDVELKKAGEELGFELSAKEVNLLGFPTETWKEDIKARAQELKDAKEMIQLKKAEKVLKKNFSDDDKFNMEMSEIDDVLADI